MRGQSALFLPVTERRSVWGATLLLFLYYAATAARDLSYYDSGELALAAVQLGLGHPPGQPLHTLLGFVFAHLPLVTPLYGVSLLSVLPAALVLVPAVSLAEALFPRAPRAGLIALPFLLALIALHPVLWEPATRVEVYALATFFALWATARLATLSTTVDAQKRQLLSLGLSLGLCTSANPMIALCTGLALVPALSRLFLRERRLTSGVAWLLGGGLCGLLPYLYVILIAGRSDVMIWGAPRDAQSLWHYLSLRDYAHNQQISLHLWGDHVLSWALWAVTQMLAPLLVLGMLGHALLGAHSALGRVAAPLLLFFLVSVISFNVVWHLDVPDYNGYIACVLWLTAAGAGALFLHALEKSRKRIAVVLAALLLLGSLGVAPTIFARTRHRDRLPRALAERALHEAPPFAIVIAQTDVLLGSLFYLQEAERKRPDVVVLASGLLASSWHWERIYRTHPLLKPIVLRQPGGDAARVQRFLAANRQRPVLIERFALAAQFGLRACAGGLLLRTGTACEITNAPDLAPAKLFAETLASLSGGSPSAQGAIAAASYALGEALWRLGHPRAAFATLLSGVPLAMRPKSQPSPKGLERAPPLTGGLPAWQRSAALGDPARNLFVAGAIWMAARGTTEARTYVRAAAADGLPEALR